MQLTTDDDFAAAAPSTVVRVCSSVLMIAGLLTALTGLQLVLAYLIGPVAVVPYVLLVLGVAAIALGWMAGRARWWAATSGLALAALLALLNLGWFVYAAVHGLYSCMSLISVPAAIGAAVAMVFTLQPVKRATLARARLRDQGMDVGI